MSDQDEIETLLENSRVTNLHASFFNASTFKKPTVDLCLESDHVSNVKAFYNAVCSAIKTSHALSIRIMPDFDDLQPNITIERMMEPARKNHNNESAKHFVSIFSQRIFDFLKGPTSKSVIDGKHCPNARMTMDTCFDLRGLPILDVILSWNTPRLGARVNITSTVEHLSILPNDTLASFFVRCSKCDRAV